MIRRYTSGTGLSHSEPLHQASFTAVRGVDSSKAVTVPNVVNRLENLTVNSDGSVSVRKPLIVKKEYASDINGKRLSANAVIPLYTSGYSAVVYIDGTYTYLSIENGAGECSRIVFYGEPVDYSNPFTVRVTTVTDNAFIYDVSDLFDLSTVNYINVSSETILGNLTVNLFNDLVSPWMFNPDVQSEMDATKSPRYLVIKKDDSDTFKVTIKTSEINTLTSGSDLVLDPNLTLDTAYATRDMYDSSYTSIDGIVPYVYCSSDDVPSKVDSHNISEGAYKETFEHTFESKSTYWQSILPPYNPLVIEFLSNMNVFSVAMSANDSEYFMRYGGAAKIWLNKFKFSDTHTNSLSDVMEVCAAKPSKVHVQVFAHFLNDSYTLHVDSLGTLETGANIILNYSTDGTASSIQIEGDASTGYWVTLTDLPVAQHLLGVHGTGTLSEHTIYLSDSDNSTDTNNKTVAGTIYCPTYPGFRPQYRLHSNTYDSKYGWTFKGVGLYHIELVVTVEYRVAGEDANTVRYNSSVMFGLNTLAGSTYSVPGTGGYLRRCLDSSKSLVGANYPALIHSGTSVFEGNVLYTQNVNSELFADKSALLKLNTTFEERILSKRNDYETKIINNKYPQKTPTVTVPRGVFDKKANFNIVLNTQAPTPYNTLSADVVIHDSASELYRETVSDIKYNIVAHTTELNSNTYKVTVPSTLHVSSITYPLLQNYSVRALTERVFYPKFQIASTLGSSLDCTVLLKAFMNLQNPDDLEYYGVWEYSTDGVDWKSWYDLNRLEAFGFSGVFKTVDLPKYTIEEDSNIGNHVSTVEAHSAVGVKFTARSPDDVLYAFYDGNKAPTKSLNDVAYIVPMRADVLILQSLQSSDADKFCIAEDIPIDSIQIRFTVVTLPVGTNKEYKVLDTQFYTPDPGLRWEFASSLFGNAILGEKLYHRNKIYSYNHDSFGCAVLSSSVKSFITPLSEVIDISSSAKDVVTSLISWRNYLIAFTEHGAHLITPSDTGAFIKTITTYIGVPQQDRRTCKALLNGVVFKSGPKFYTLYPNASSGDESILNLNEISHPINHILEQLPDTDCDTFSISTERKYYTFIPYKDYKDYKDYTYSVIYDYDLKVWCVGKYEGVRLTGYSMDGLNDITVYGICNGILTEYYFDKELSEAYPNIADDWDVDYDSIPYGDYLTEASLTPPPARTELPKPEAIHFELDSGQRTDNISLTRKFVESKFILATLNSKPAANIDVDVYIDGSPYKTHLKGDGIVFKDSPDDIITLGDDNPSDESNVYNTLSQVYLRYSGKGKTIRHVITGDSLYNFKLYEVFYRYRPMPNKQ